MNWKLCLILALVCSANLVFGQSLRYMTANPYVGVSTYSSKQNDAFSFTGNQAALAGLKSAGVGVYGERRFMLQELSAYTAVAAMPTALGNVGLQLNYAGFSAFSETRLGLAYAKSLGKLLAVGIQFNYMSYRMPQYGNASTVNFEGGALFHLSQKLNAGIYTFNPVPAKMNKGTEKPAGIYKIGFGYDVSDEFFTGVEIIKEENRTVNVTGAIQYQFKKQFFVRTGFRSDNATVFAGAGLALKQLRLDVATSYHPQLGFSPGLMLLHQFKQKGDE